MEHLNKHLYFTTFLLGALRCAPPRFGLVDYMSPMNHNRKAIISNIKMLYNLDQLKVYQNVSQGVFQAQILRYRTYCAWQNFLAGTFSLHNEIRGLVMAKTTTKQHLPVLKAYVGVLSGMFRSLRDGRNDVTAVAVRRFEVDPRSEIYKTLFQALGDFKQLQDPVKKYLGSWTGKNYRTKRFDLHKINALVLSGETYTKSFESFYKDAISNWLPSYMYTLAKYTLPELVVRQQIIGRYWARRLEVQEEHENAMVSIDNEFAALKASRLERRNTRIAAKSKQEADGTRLSI
jgi:hypothetical protein